MSSGSANEIDASEFSFRALADSMPQLVWTADAQGVVGYYNARAREYDGIEPLRDGSWHWQPGVHPDDLAHTVDAWKRAVQSGEPYSCEHRVRMADGSYRWHISRARLIAYPSGDRWFGTATDIHEQKTLEESLRHAVATRDQVVSVVSHDLRSPLGVLRLAVGQMRRVLVGMPQGQAVERASSYLTRMDRQVSKMEKLLDELLDSARLQAGRRLELERRSCDLVALVRELVDEQTATAGHTIRVDAKVSSLVGEWDPARLERVLANLLSNALKYSAEGSEVTIELELVDDRANVRVRDRGVGIAEHDRARIFEWFVRGENVEHTARGSGVGLAGSRRIVEQHGGTLTVQSELGTGSTFVMALPLGVHTDPS
jgi:PAS domain S-box-containing protein